MTHSPKRGESAVSAEFYEFLSSPKNFLDRTKFRGDFFADFVVFRDTALANVRKKYSGEAAAKTFNPAAKPLCTAYVVQKKYGRGDVVNKAVKNFFINNANLI
jgi:hypothetical protein